MQTPNLMPAPEPDPEHTKPLSLREVVGSIMAGLLGVQSSRNHARDFARGTAGQYIVVGLIATIVLVLLMYLTVKLILRLAVN